MVYHECAMLSLDKRIPIKFVGPEALKRRINLQNTTERTLNKVNASPPKKNRRGTSIDSLTH